MTQHTCAKKRDPQVLSGGFMVLWAVFMATWPVCVSKGGGGSILTGGHVEHPGPHQALFAQVWGLPRRLRQRFLLDDLSTRLGHPDNSLHSSAVMCKRHRYYSVNASCVPDVMPVLLVECLTFQVLILLAHCPHTDLVVDHVDTRKAASETG